MTPPKIARPRWRVSTSLWRRLLTRLQRVSRAVVAARLGSQTKERRNGYLRRFLEVLAKHGSFAWGGSVAYSLASIARTLTCCQRTAERIVGMLRQMPELVHVRLVPPGELAWDGKVSSREHNEFTRGPLWLETVEAFEAELEPPKTEQPPLETPRNSNGFLRPMADITSDDSAQSSTILISNFSPSSMDCEGSRARGKKAQIVEKGSFRPLAFPERPQEAKNVPDVTREVIVQHRAIAEGKGPGVRITQEDVDLLDTARSSQPNMPDADWRSLCERVSRKALEDAEAKALEKAEESGKPQPPATANLKYTFGAPHFAKRVERLKEAEYVSETTRAVIVQHRKIAEGKGEGVPISQEEADLLDAARATQPRMPHPAWIRLCRGVSRLALEDAQAQAKRANLSFTFAAKFFVERVARLREFEQAARKARYAAEHRASRGSSESEERSRLRAASFEKAGDAPPRAVRVPRPRPRPAPPPAETSPEPIRISAETRNNLEIRGQKAARAGETHEQPPQPPPQAAPEPPAEPPRPEPKPEPPEPPEPPEKALEPEERRRWLYSLPLKEMLAEMTTVERHEFLRPLSVEQKIRVMEEAA